MIIFAGALVVFLPTQATACGVPIQKQDRRMDGAASGPRNSKSGVPGRVFRDTGYASWYGGRFQGSRTASGETFDKHKFTAAHPSLPFGTKARVTNLKNNRSVVVHINDRGPFAKGRIMDLSLAAARRIGIIGIAPVRIEVLLPAG